MSLNRKQRISFSKSKMAWSLLVTCLSLLSSGQSAQADVIREDNAQLEGLKDERVYEWKDTEQKPKAVAIAVHGLILHGGVYDKMARELASQGFVVVAPDLRGYGRWLPGKPAPKQDEEFQLNNAAITPIDGSVPSEVIDESATVVQSKLTRSSKISYEKSYSDLKQLVVAVRNRYPSLPVFIIGESLGAGLALHLAADMPQSINGLVLSSPAIKHRFFMEPRMVMDVAVLMASPSKRIDLVPYIKRFASNDPEVIDSALQDPLVRKKLTPLDLWRTRSLIRSNVHHAERIPDNMPVLIIQGDRDRMLKTNGVVVLLDHLKCKDQTVKWFPGKGHLLLETPHIMPETMTTVQEWLLEHARDASLAKAAVQETASDEGLMD